MCASHCWGMLGHAGAPHALLDQRNHGPLGITPCRRLLLVGRAGPCDGTPGGGHQLRPNAPRSQAHRGQAHRGHYKWPVPAAAGAVARWSAICMTSGASDVSGSLGLAVSQARRKGCQYAAHRRQPCFGRMDTASPVR